MPRRPQLLLGLAACSAAAAAVVWFVALHLDVGRNLDDRALRSFAGVGQPRLTSSIEGIARLADPTPLLIGGALLVGVALLRGRRLLAAAVPAILLAANATTQLLKPVLGDVRTVDRFGELLGNQQVFAGSWPSGHSTAAMSLALCAVLVAGPALRPLAALLGAGYAIAVGYSLVVLGHHLPSDVLGGYLVAATFALLGAAALSALEARAPRVRAAARPPPALSLPALTLAASMVMAAGGLALLAGRPVRMVEVLGHTTAIVSAAAIAVIGLALTGGLARALRR